MRWNPKNIPLWSKFGKIDSFVKLILLTNFHHEVFKIARFSSIHKVSVFAGIITWDGIQIRFKFFTALKNAEILSLSDFYQQFCCFFHITIFQNEWSIKRVDPTILNRVRFWAGIRWCTKIQNKCLKNCGL